MPEQKNDPKAASPISSKTYLTLATIFLLVSVPFYFFVHPVAFVAAIVVGLFLLVGGFYSLANERHWLD